MLQNFGHLGIENIEYVTLVTDVTEVWYWSYICRPN